MHSKGDPEDWVEIEAQGEEGEAECMLRGFLLYDQGILNAGGSKDSEIADLSSVLVRIGSPVVGYKEWDGGNFSFQFGIKGGETVYLSSPSGSSSSVSSLTDLDLDTATSLCNGVAGNAGDGTPFLPNPCP